MAAAGLDPELQVECRTFSAFRAFSVENTLSEITGACFGRSDIDPIDHDLIRNYAKTGEPIGERIIVHGRVLEGTGAAVKGALIEVWQTDSNGVYPHQKDARHGSVAAGFRGQGRAISDFETGLYQIETIKPGRGAGRQLRRMLDEGHVATEPPMNVGSLCEQLGAIHYFRITGQLEGQVWGTDICTRDPAMGAAAVHAGLVKPGESQVLRLTVVPARETYPGSSRNGVFTSDYGPFPHAWTLSAL